MTIKVERTIEVVSDWLMKVGASALPQMSISSQSGIGRLMTGIFGIDLATYNIWNELGFLLGPTVKSIVSPKLGELLANIPDDKFNEMVMTYADSFITQARMNGYVNLFGVQIGENAFIDLRAMLEQKLNQ